MTGGAPQAWAAAKLRSVAIQTKQSRAHLAAIASWKLLRLRRVPRHLRAESKIRTKRKPRNAPSSLLLLRLNSPTTRFDSMAASLEDIISAKLAAMGLDNEDNTTFILGIVEEDSFEPEVSLWPSPKQ